MDSPFTRATGGGAGAAASSKRTNRFTDHLRFLEDRCDLAGGDFSGAAAAGWASSGAGAAAGAASAGGLTVAGSTAASGLAGAGAAGAATGAGRRSDGGGRRSDGRGCGRRERLRRGRGRRGQRDGNRRRGRFLAVGALARADVLHSGCLPCDRRGTNRTTSIDAAPKRSSLGLSEPCGSWQLAQEKSLSDRAGRDRPRSCGRLARKLDTCTPSILSVWQP